MIYSMSTTGAIGPIDVERSGRWGTHLHAALLGTAPLPVTRDPAAGPHTVLWSGSPAHADGAELFAPDPRVWSAEAWRRFTDACVAYESRWGETATLCVRTHARHVLSDVPSCVRFTAWVQERGSPLRLVLDPLSMLTPELLVGPAAADHLRRRYEAALLPGLRTSTAAVIVANGRPGAEHLEPCGLFDGIFPPALIADLVRDHVPHQTALILLGDDAAGQAALLGR